ncbi:MAG: hypothetical protein VYC34_04715 [Planctomycetota bacterium]|nr:hypothetical protein [Planctomycetota bacterium]
MRVCAAAALCAAAGCGSKTRVEAPRYNDSAERLATLDIQVRMEDDSQIVAMTNTTAQEFGRSRLWLNGWFSREIEGLEVGESLRLPVRSFRNEFGEPMRAGGFFSTKAPDPLVLAELQTDAGLHRLIVVD